MHLKFFGRPGSSAVLGCEFKHRPGAATRSCVETPPPLAAEDGCAAVRQHRGAVAEQTVLRPRYPNPTLCAVQLAGPVVENGAVTPAEPNAGDDFSRNTTFATTHWSVVLSAGQSNSGQAVEALEKLCRTYWYPLYAYVRRQGHSPEEAQDLTQDFFARFLAKDYLHEVDRSKGRFRSFLLAAMKHFLANEWDRSRAQKRGGRIHFVPLENEAAERRYQGELATELSPDKLYEQRWACVLLEQVMEHLERDFDAGGQSELFRALKPFLVGDHPEKNYAGLAVKLYASEAALKMKVQRLRHRYQSLLRQEIANTLGSPDEVEDEIRYLFSVLSG
jgi:DNA-directed RNA polymerase specialized sigma24 family protein